MVSDRLFFGRAIGSDGRVTDEQWSTFVREVVEPRFSDGFTIYAAHGQWRGGSEDSFVLEVIHADDPRADRLLAEIAEEYKRRFHQEAVLRVKTRVVTPTVSVRTVSRTA